MLYVAEFVARVARETGIILDRTYTGKAACGMIDLMKNRPEVFKGRRVMFFNSGKTTLSRSCPITI